MQPTPTHAVLNTNVLVSALLFENGRLSWLRSSWQSSQVLPLLAQPTAIELLRVLAYPTFKLQLQERDQLLAELLPWCETWRAALTSSSHTVRDGHDQVCLDLALTARADALVSGDGDLLALKGAGPTAEDLLPCRVSGLAQSWGNSLGVRIPRGLAEEVGLGAGNHMQLHVVAGLKLADHHQQDPVAGAISAAGDQQGAGH